MDTFKEFIVNNEIENTVGEVARTTKYREILSKVMLFPPTVKFITDCDENGDIIFTVDTKDIGIEKQDFYKFNREISSNFFVDFVGELILRENLHLFVPLLTKLSSDFYLSAVAHGEHKRFGMKVKDNCNLMIFRFHVSLLQKILTEDFKNV